MINPFLSSQYLVAEPLVLKPYNNWGWNQFQYELFFFYSLWSCCILILRVVSCLLRAVQCIRHAVHSG
jgi:hypothetical protein